MNLVNASSCENFESPNSSSFIDLRMLNNSVPDCDNVSNNSLCDKVLINHLCGDVIFCNNTLFVNKYMCIDGDNGDTTKDFNEICSVFTTCNDNKRNNSLYCNDFVCGILSTCLSNKQCPTVDSRPDNEANVISKSRLILVVLAAFMSFTFMTISLIAFTRTKRTPRVGRFLSSWLIAFHVIRQIIILLRSLTGFHSISFHFRIQNIVSVYLTYMTIAMMSFERAMYFQWPHFYLRYLTFARAKRISFTMWITFNVVSLVLIYIKCPLSLNINSLIYDKCIVDDLSAFGQVALPVCLVVSFLSFIIVFKVIRQQMRRTNSEIGLRNTLNRYKATIVVFFHLVIVCVFTLLLLIYSILLRSLNRQYILFVNDLCSVIRGILDTLFYVLWFSECRMELMKMFVCVFPSLQTKIESMKMKIFAIQSSDERLNA